MNRLPKSTNCDLAHFIDEKNQVGRGEVAEGESNRGNGNFITRFPIPWHFL